MYRIKNTKNDVFEYTIYNTNEIAITGVIDKYQTPMVIPETIDGMRVTGVDWSWGYGDYISEVILPDGITWIGDRAFQWTGLSAINLPDSLVWIGDSAFYDCRLKELELPESLVWIGENAFYHVLAERHQGGYKDIYIMIPKSTRMIGREAFDGNSNLKEITVHKDNEYFVMDNGVLYTANYEILVYMNGVSEMSSYHVKDGCVKIGDAAFSGCWKLEKIVIPDTVYEIGEDAFRGCRGLKEIVLPSGVKEIKSGTFENCEALESVIFPASLEVIRTEAFGDCDALKEMIIPKNVVEIEQNAFEGCDNIAYYGVEEGNQHFSSIGGNLFNKDGTIMYQYALGKEEPEYVIPKEVLEIGAGAFEYTAHTGFLNKVIIPHGVQRIGESAFCISSIKEIVVPATVKTIGASAFFCSDVEKVVIEDGVEIIERQAFDACDELREIHISKSVIEIQENVFNDTGNVPIIYTEPGTYAEQYAKENGISVKYE